MRKKLLYLSILCMGLFSYTIQVHAAEDINNSSVTENIIVELEKTTEVPGTDMIGDSGATAQNGNVTESIQKGWIYDENGWIYIDESGNQLKNCWKEIDGKYYWFENTGIMASDMWIGDFYVDSSGAWIPDKHRYKEGWIQSGSSWWYQYADGSYATNWKYINQVWYFFDNNGWMQTGWQSIGGTWYYMSETGAMQTGWTNIGGTWYYMSDTGAMQTGWTNIGGTWYYMSESGAMQTGWTNIGGIWYYMSESGAMQTDWANIEGIWYYMSETGAMQTGWINIGETWYYMSESGAMQSGLQFIGDDVYILEASGAMVANDNYNFNGGNLSIGADGRVEKQTASAIKKAYNKLNQVGWDLRKAFNWSAGIPYYRMQNYGIGPQTKDIHSVWYANYGFDNGRGNCYVMAATFCYMARLLGYETYFVEGQVPLAVGGMGPHGWCEIVVDGFTYVFDPDFTNNTGRNGYQIYYGMSGTWRYSNYKRVA